MSHSTGSSSTSALKELTIRSAAIGILLAVVMGAANVYLGLKVGMTVSASIPAAVLGIVLLRIFFRNSSILEANQVQTAASAGESLAAGIIFTMPALILIGYWQQFDMLVTTAIAFTGGLLGVLFMIPMRHVFITNAASELKYPEGLACAAVLKAGTAEQESGHSSGARHIIYGALFGGLIKLLISFVGLVKGMVEGATLIGQRVFYFGSDISPALVAVGYIVGLNIAVLIFIGGGLGWLVAIPFWLVSSDVNALDAAWDLWSRKVRYLGVGAMVVGGIASIFQVRHGLVQAVREIRKAALPKDGKEITTNRDLPASYILFFSMLAVALVAAIYFYITKDIGITVITTLTMLVMSFFFTAVASYIVGLVGNSNSPVSGMTITAVLFTGGMIYIFGYSGMQGMAATLGVAAIVCCAACTSGDVCNDLKTGQLVGASPYKQQIMQILGVAAASLIMAPVLQLLHDHTPGGIGGRELSAPQAALFASLVRGFFGDGNIPWNLVFIGAGLGVVVLIIDAILQQRKASFRMYLMPVAVGMYLPFGIATPILLGGLLHYLVTRQVKKAAIPQEPRGGVLFASGIIAGESLMGVGLAILASIGLTRIEGGFGPMTQIFATALAAAVCVTLFYRLSYLKK